MHIDDKEDLIDIIEMEGWPLLLKELEALVRDQESKLIKFNLSGPNAGAELIIEKARAEGALRLFVAFKQRMDSLKPRPTKK